MVRIPIPLSTHLWTPILGLANFDSFRDQFALHCSRRTGRRIELCEFRYHFFPCLHSRCPSSDLRIPVPVYSPTFALLHSGFAVRPAATVLFFAFLSGLECRSHRGTVFCTPIGTLEIHRFNAAVFCLRSGLCEFRPLRDHAARPGVNPYVWDASCRYLPPLPEHSRHYGQW
jgi:hypothetical protein